MSPNWIFLAATGCALVQAQPLRFDAASIKPNISGGRGGNLVQLTAGRVAGRNVTARRIILEAYHVTGYQLSGGPDWLDSDRFALEAKAGAPANEDQLRLMLQTLLAERFQLTVHRETKEMLVFAVTVGKGGMKFREMKPGDPTPTRPPIEPGAEVVEFYPSNVQDFIDGMNRMDMVGRPMINKTGLNGIYFFDLQLMSGEDFATMLQQRSGLKLESQKAAMEVLVIDRIEKPGAN